MAEGEILDRIEKHMEGTSLGLAALAEVLQKMDYRMEADDNYAIQKAEEDRAYYEQTALVKNIAKAVLVELADQGMDVDGTKEEKVGKPDPTKSAKATPNYIGDADDSSESVTPRTKIEEQQASIQAESNEDEEEENGEEDRFPAAEELDEEKAYMGKRIQNAENDDEEEENGEDEEVEKLQKQLSNLQKQIAGLDIKKAVKNESEDRLRKMGFKEENGLQRPKIVRKDSAFGADEIPLKKAEAANINDVVDQLSNLSYKELRRMQAFHKQGQLEGLPDEIARLT